MPLKRSLTRFFKRGKCDSATEVKPCAEDVENTGSSIKPLMPQGTHGSLQDRPQQDHVNSSMATIRPSMSDVDLLKHDKFNGKSLFRSLSTSITRVKNRASGALLQKQTSNTQLKANSLVPKTPQKTTLRHKTNAINTSARQVQLGASVMALPQRSPSPSRTPLKAMAIRRSEHSSLPQEQGPRMDSLAYTRPEMANPHRNGKKLFEGLHSDLEPILKTAKSGERRKSAIKRRSLHGTKRVSFANEPHSKRSQPLEPSVTANLGLRTSSQRTLMQQQHRLEKRLSSGPGRRRSTLMTIVACQSDSSASDEASVETDKVGPENQIYDRQVLAQLGDDSHEHHPPARACYSDFVRHNTMKRSGHPPADLSVPSNLRRTTPRRRSVLVPALHCKIQADQPSQTLRRHPRLQDIPSEALS